MMLYVAIDQHAKQITVAIRDDQGEDVLKRQVSTRPEKISEFFDRVVAMDAEFMAILESCGFAFRNDQGEDVLKRCVTPLWP